MTSMPEPSNPRTTDSADFREGYAEGFVDCIVMKTKISPEVAAVAKTFAERHDELTGPEQKELRDAIASAFLPDGTTREDCPEWCTFDHSEDGDDDLILHMGDDHVEGTVRKLMTVHEGSKLDVRVARTDCPPEGTTGKPTLMVRCDLELTTWEQAAELARTILDSFGYLHGA